MSFPKSFKSWCLTANVSATLAALFAMPTQAQSAGPAQPALSTHQISVSVYDRTRVDAWQWFAAPPKQNSYGYVESLVRLGVAQRLQNWDWQLELSQPAVLGLPSDAVSSVTAQGQLGLGGTYYASAANNANPVAVSLKQAFLRYHPEGTDKSLRLGRFEFIEGQEMSPRSPTLRWLQTNRIAHRLIGNFGFSNSQRSLDGLDAHFGKNSWDVTALVARADQGVFNMNANPELNVDLQYLAFTRSALNDHMLVRAFGLGYHDGRTGLTKTDNRALAVRSTDHGNIRIGTYGGDLLLTAPAGRGSVDLLIWGALQNGRWGSLSHSAGASAVEGGYQLNKVRTSPWVRAGWFRSTGDANATDAEHNTFFQVLPTPRIYARDPFYNLMNSTDSFLQVMERPAKKLALRSDLHWLKLTSASDLWYLGGGAFDNKVFGYTGRPSNGHSSFATVTDISADYQLSKTIALNLYYSHVWGKSVVGSIYSTGRNSNYGYVEFVYQWGRPAGGVTK